MPDFNFPQLAKDWIRPFARHAVAVGVDGDAPIVEITSSHLGSTKSARLNQQ
jgi:hypothetical protein